MEPKPIPLVQSSTHSLAPDMIFGWKPKNFMYRAPVPLNFYYNYLPNTRNKDNQSYKTVYFGYRPQDSHIMHKRFEGEYSYDFNHPLESVIEYTSKMNKMKNKNSERKFEGNLEGVCDLKFDSCFEGGNLDKVVYTGNEYQLYMRADSNTRGHYKWFYFKVKNTGEGQVFRFSVLNFKYSYNLFCSGMKPVYKHTYSQEWKSIQSKVEYKKSPLNTKMNSNTFYMMNFELTIEEEGELYIALTQPYLYSDLTKYIENLPPIVEKSVLTQTLTGVDVPLLTINKSSAKKKEYIVIIGRVHPSETVSSFVVEGFIDFLISSEDEARYLRENFVIKIVPMANPDGVIIGNGRTGITGEDLNRKYIDPDELLHPEPYHIKKLVQGLKSSIFTVIDIHGHFTKKGSFLYGPYFPLHSHEYYRLRVIPKLLSERSEPFRYYSCKFSSEKSRKKTARLVFAREFGISHSYTLENSLYAYMNSERQIIPFTAYEYGFLGGNLGKTLAEYKAMIEHHKEVKYYKARQRLRKKKALQSRKKNYIKRTLKEVIESIKQEEEVCSNTSGEDCEEVGEEAPNEVFKSLLNFSSLTNNSDFRTALKKEISKPLEIKEPSKMIKSFLPSVRESKKKIRPVKTRSEMRVRHSPEPISSTPTPEFEGFKVHVPVEIRKIKFAARPPSRLLLEEKSGSRITSKSPVLGLFKEEETKCSLINLADIVDIESKKLLNGKKRRIKKFYETHKLFGPFAAIPVINNRPILL